MERNSHNSICSIESLFDAISVMDINIDIQHSLVVFEKFEYTQHNVINVTKSWCFRFFCMMKTAPPIDTNFRSLNTKPYIIFSNIDTDFFNPQQNLTCLLSFTAAATDPPAESWQNSYRPSKTGQSSPTLTVEIKMKI